MMRLRKLPGLGTKKKRESRDRRSVDQPYFGRRERKRGNDDGVNSRNRRSGAATGGRPLTRHTKTNAELGGRGLKRFGAK